MRTNYKKRLIKKEITEEEFELAYKVANNLIKQINGKTEEIIKFTTKYFNLLKEVENDNNTFKLKKYIHKQ